jgi:hypothetical protein
MRIRTIKPGFFLDPDIYDAEKETGLPLRVAYIGLWCAADRDGYFEWEPRKLGAQILPYDLIDFSRVLDACLTREFIEKYVCESGDVGFIPTFATHQVINNREAPSILRFQAQNGTRAPRVDDACSRVVEVEKRKGKEGKGREGNGLAPKGACEPSGSRSPVDWNFITEWWNRIADKNRLSKINGMTEIRKKKWQTRIAAGMDIAKVEDAINAASDFIREGWFGFDWFIESENNLAKLVEGKYAAKTAKGTLFQVSDEKKDYSL